jgi:tetratricopeptide (TPR) repeat protein/NADH:ubiquinone oxidoreductase subunit K
MLKDWHSSIKICDLISKFCILSAVFLVPLIFLPWTSDVLDFNKQAVLIPLVSVSLFCWMIRSLVSGKFQLNFNKTNIAVSAMLLVYLLATLFSINRYGSFWGWPQPTSESLISYIFFAVAYFLTLNVFSKKDIPAAIITFLVSSFIAQIIGVFQILGVYLPFDFAKFSSFNTIGSVGSIGFFSVISLCLAFAMIIISKKGWKIFFGVEILSSAAILFLVNFPIVWWALAIAMAAIVIIGIAKRDFFDGRWMALPMFFLAISVFFIILSPQIPGLTQKTNEVFLSQQASFKIAWQALLKNPVLGSGLGTFSYDFLMFKEPSFSSTSVWGVVFPQGTSKILTDLATTGVLGLIAILAAMAFSIFYTTGYLFFVNPSREEPADEDEKGQAKSKSIWIVSLGLSAAFFAEVFMFFFYNSNFVLSFTFFFVMGCLINIVSKEQRQYELKGSSKITIITAFAFALMFTFGLGIWALGGQRYVAEIYYNKGLSRLQAGDVDGGTKNIETAASLNPHSDLYFRQLSLLYMSKLSNELKNVSDFISDDKKGELQTLISNSINASKVAEEINPNNAANLINRGFIFQNLVGLVPGAQTWALQEYDAALKIDPNNPYTWMQKGNVNFIMSQQAQQDEKNKLLAEAQNSIEKAVSLNSVYYEALYSLGLVYDGQGQKDKAIEIFNTLQKVNSGDEGIIQILKNLNSGLPALLQASLPSSQTPPESLQPDSVNNQSVKQQAEE